MKILCISDPLTKIPTDTSVALYNRLAEDPRFELYHLDANAVGPDDEIPVLRIAAPLSFQELQGLPANITAPARYTDFDLVYSRADKPFPPAYLPGLIRQEEKVRFVARPSSVLECDPRTFYRTRLDRYLPPGLVTRDIGDASSFIRKTGAVVVKQNRSYGGKGVWRIRPAGATWVLDHGGIDLEACDRPEPLVDRLLHTDAEPFEFVRFLPNVGAGDKRIIVLEGEILGAILRVATDGGWINNLSRGGRAEVATVGDAERNIIGGTSGLFHQRGLPLIGYDFLQDDDGEWLLSEIGPGGNIGGFTSIERVTGRSPFPRLLDWLLEFAAR
ncbi:MAG TPA: hypothetical protein VJU15_13675 [Gemmatimonadales bacterium]|nr:hypothetical protein [Gemmatimonadales bacterium]